MADRHAHPIQAVWLLALIAVTLSLIPAGAHFFELANKAALPAQQYMTVQRIYAGWAFFGIAVFCALALTFAHTLMVRTHRAAFMLSLSALLAIVIAQAIFWSFTYPMNVATSNWTAMPLNFESARRQWEYSHAAGAVVMFAGFISLALSMLVSKPVSR